MKKSKGFKRLKGLAAASAVSLAGLLSGGSARAASTALGVSVTRGGVNWLKIGHNTSFPSAASVTTTSGVSYSSKINAFGIREAKFNNGASTFIDAFDNALILAVDGNLFLNPDSTVDLTGDVLTTDVLVNIVTGVDAQIQYRFYPSRPLVRAMYSLTNTTALPISVDPVILGDYGSDVNTTVQATSDANSVIENTDLWYITDDNLGTGDPRVTITRYGSGAAVVPFNALTPSGATPVFGLRYPVTIAAGATVRILVFAELGDPSIAVTNQVAAAADFTSETALDAANLIDDLNSAVRSEVINYGLTLPVELESFTID